MTERKQDDLRLLLDQHEILGVVPEPFRAYSFSSGGEILAAKERLAPRFVSLWASSLSRNVDDPLVLRDSDTYPYGDDSLIIVEDKANGNFAAIFLYRTLSSDEFPSQHNGLYLHICLVNKRYQGKGLTSRLIARTLSQTKAEYIALHTQNEYMVQTLRKFIPKGRLFPIDGTLPTEYDIARRLHTSKPENYDESVMVERGLYAHAEPLYGDRKERHSTHPDIREFFQKNVDFQHGDSVLVIGVSK